MKVSVYYVCTYLRRRNVRVVCTSDVNIHQQMTVSSTASGMVANSSSLRSLFTLVMRK